MLCVATYTACSFVDTLCTEHCSYQKISMDASVCVYVQIMHVYGCMDVHTWDAMLRCMCPGEISLSKVQNCVLQSS